MDASGRVAVEIGGTFTDIVVFETDAPQARIRALKTPTTPKALTRGVIEGIGRLGADWPSLREVMHGSTVGTNAVLERKGVPTALLVTAGFQDILEIQRGDKSNIYDIFYRRPQPVVPRQWVLPVPERLDAEGGVLVPLDEAAVRALASRLVAGGIRSVAICFLHSYVNPVHEQRVQGILTEAAPGLLVLTSSELLPQFREYERASTVAVAAYVSPIMTSYVEELASEFQARGFAGNLFMTQSNGGVLPAGAIGREGVRTLLSGPAAGVTGAVHAAAQAGFREVITFDMGGTSTDVCLVRDGTPLITTDSKLNGLPVAVPMIDIATVGAGGGSIAGLDEHAMLYVGPESAGANPGPACYQRGGTLPTVTDANLVRGVIRAKSFAGGSLVLDSAAANAVLAGLGRQLGMSPLEAADAVVRIVEAHMTEAIRLVSTERGHDPREYVLVAFGGAGPIHAASIAAELGVVRVLVPAHAGVLSAFGLLVADIARDYVQTKVAVVEDVPTADILRCFSALTERATAEFLRYGISAEQLTLLRSCDARYQGQAYELPISLDLGSVSCRSISERFHETHRRRYGFAFESERVEIVNYRLKATVPRKADGLSAGVARTGPVRAEEGDIRLGRGTSRVMFYRGETLTPETVITGPAVIEEATSTCFVPLGWRASPDRSGGILLERMAP